jgi:hypothetical protein
MNLETGKELMNGAAEVNEHLGTLTTLVEAVEDEALRLKIKRELGFVIAKIYTRLMVPVLREHPQLDPDPPTDTATSPDKG